MSPQARRVRTTLPVILVAGALAAISVAHVDDPKARDRVPPYSGPGWCSTGCVGGGGEGGIAGAPPINFPSSNVQLLAWLPVTQFGAQNTTGNTVEGYVSPTGREYAIIGLSDGTGFVDVTDPGSPVIVTFVPSVESLWHDVRVYQHYCYNVSEGGGGIQIIDMSNLDSSSVSVVGNVTTGPTPSSTHTMFINQASGFLYRAGGGSNGLRIYNLANPASPAYVTAWTDKYVHEVTVHSYNSGPYAGKEIAFCCGGDNSGNVNPGLYILDVTNVTDRNPDTNGITQLSYYGYPQARFCHQGWLSEDLRYFYINDEKDDQQLGLLCATRVVDVSDLSAPVQVGQFTSGAGGVDHNLYVKGNLIYESNYRTGLRVFDATNPTAPKQIAFFDTWPQDNNVNFNGLWDNYPFLPSGIVLGSDMEKGLFIWRVGAELLLFEYPDGQPPSIHPVNGTVDLHINSGEGVVDPASGRLHYSINGGAFAEAPLQWLGGTSFRAEFPTMGCGSLVRWHLSAQTTSGITVRDPLDAPTSAYEAVAAVDIAVGVEDTIETATGWVVGATGDNATSGIWIRSDPVGTAVQPEDDHTAAPGVMCFVTGNGTPGSTSVGQADVDGGTTTLTSPNMNATAQDEAYIVYHRWYANTTTSNPGADTMPVLISNNGGSTWTQLELVNENAGAWVKKSFRIADFVTPTNQIKIRFQARDLSPASTVEAAVDDVRIEYLNCGGASVPGDITGDGEVDVDDLLAIITAWGSCPAPPATCAADLVRDGEIDVDDLLFVITHWG